MGGGLFQYWMVFDQLWRNTTRGGTMGMPLEINSSVRKSKKENQECTSGDYWFICVISDWFFCFIPKMDHCAPILEAIKNPDKLWDDQTSQLFEIQMLNCLLFRWLRFWGVQYLDPYSVTFWEARFHNVMSSASGSEGPWFFSEKD